MKNRAHPVTSLLLVTVLAAAAFGQAPLPATRPTSAPTLGEPRLVLTRDGSVSVGNAALDIRRLRDALLASAWTTEPGRNLMRAAGLTEQAARQALTFRPNENGWTFRMVLSLPRDSRDVREAATAFMDTLGDRVIQPAAEQLVAESRHAPVERAQRALAEARERAAEATQEAAKRRQQVRAAAQVLDPSPDAVRTAAARLDQERQKISLELAGQAARQRALEERVAKLSDAAAARVAKDEIAAELEKIVKIREKEAALHADLRVHKEVNDADVATAQAAVAEARARLLERREAAARSAGSDLLADLNKELVTLTISIAENEARQRYIETRLDGLGRALELADDLEQSIAAAARARRQADFAESQLQEARSRVEQLATDFPVSVGWGDPAVDGPETGGSGGGGGGGRGGGGGGGGGGLFVK